MKHLFLLVVVGLVSACNGNGGPPPPPPTTTVPVTTTLPITTTIPLPINPCDTPIEKRVREDYIPISRADTLREKLQDYDNRLHNNGWVNPGLAIQNCGERVFPYNGLRLGETLEVMEQAREIKIALTGKDGRSGFYERLGLPHRKYGPGRSTVYQPCFSEWMSRARLLLNGSGTDTNPNGPVSRLDGIWAECQRILGWK